MDDRGLDTVVREKGQKGKMTNQKEEGEGREEREGEHQKGTTPVPGTSASTGGVPSEIKRMKMEEKVENNNNNTVVVVENSISSNGHLEEGINGVDVDEVNGTNGTRGTTNGEWNTTNTTSSSAAVGGARPKVKKNASGEEEDEQQQQQHLSNGSNHGSNGRFDDCNSDSDDDLIYTYRGGGTTGINVQTSQSNPVMADLPKSFYQLEIDVGSDNSSDTTTTVAAVPAGVSGAGQSNLSTEVAALIQSEMASVMLDNNGGVASAEARGLQNNGQGRPQSPAMDFLEMDFVDSGGDSDDSGQGGDENVTETNEEDSEANEGEDAEAVAELEDDDPAGAHPVAGPSSHYVPDSLPLRPGASGHISSVPAVTPVREDLSLMVRSRSLNSPLASKVNGETSSSASGACCMARGESDPSGTVLGRARRHSGDLSNDQLLNMEICGAKLSQREAFVFGGSSDRGKRPSFGWRRSPPSLFPASLLEKKTMIWTELEACSRQVKQVGVSACGATAVINAMLAMDLPPSSCDVSRVTEVVRTRLRAEAAPLPEYLFSRSVAGTSHEDLISAMDQLVEDGGSVVSRFFHMHPRRSFCLSSWLAEWIGKGAVPIATLNLQKGVRPGQTVPDAWHHQMIFGVGPSGIYLTNPLEIVRESVLMDQLSSDSVLLVRRSDVVFRFDPDNCDLSALSRHPDERWDWFNVLGQVVNVLREERSKGGGQRSARTEHVRIPAAYKSGVTLFMPASNANSKELLECPELPLMQVSYPVEEGHDGNN